MVPAAETMMEMTMLKPWPSGIIALFGHLYVLPTLPSTAPQNAPTKYVAMACVCVCVRVCERDF